MAEKEFDPALNEEELDGVQDEDETGEDLADETEDETEEDSAPAKKKQRLGARIRKALPVVAIWARYLLPVATLLTLFVMSFFDSVQIYIGGKTQIYELSVFNAYVNTFKGMHAYFGGSTVAGRSWFYSIVTVGAVVGILIFLVALFFAGLAAYTAVRAFRAGHESEESDRMKLIFKVAFPNRVWLFLSELLMLLPFLYPEFYEMVGNMFLAVKGVEVIFVLLNRPLIVGGSMLALTLVLALVTPKYERRKRMNMFLLHRTEQTDTQEDDVE